MRKTVTVIICDQCKEKITDADDIVKLDAGNHAQFLRIGKSQKLDLEGYEWCSFICFSNWILGCETLAI